MAACLEITKSTKVKLNEFSCPFTWELYKMAHSCYNDEGHVRHPDVVEEEDMEIFVIMLHLLKCYESVISADTDTAETELQVAEECLERIRESKESDNIIRTIEHIVYATKCHFLYEIYDEQELKNVLENIVDIWEFTDEEDGALQGFKSVAFCLYHDSGVEKATDAAMEAIKKNGENAVWHFVLAKSLRRKRRLITVHSFPCELEKAHFDTAFMLSKSPTIGIYYAQMKRECHFNGSPWESSYAKNILEQQLLDIYEVVLGSGTKNWRLLLKITLGYIRIYNGNARIEAKKCLDTVDKLCPNNSTALHYRGLLHKQCINNTEALKWFKQAADLRNFIADLQYAELGYQLGLVNPVEHLLSMETKYSDLVDNKRQILFLKIATSYVRYNDARNAAKYYLKAIDIAPDALNLSGFFKFSNTTYRNGVYYFLWHDFLPLLAQKQLDYTLLDVIDQLRERCATHFNKQMKGLEEKLSIAKI